MEINSKDQLSNEGQELATQPTESPRPAQEQGVIRWVSDPARPLPLGSPREYQSFGGAGLISVFGAQSIYGKTVPLGSRVRVTTEVLPPTREDVEAMLAICLPSLDAPVLTVQWNGQFPPNCGICRRRCMRDEEYYRYQGFKGHKRCADQLRHDALASAVSGG